MQAWSLDFAQDERIGSSMDLLPHARGATNAIETRAERSGQLLRVEYRLATPAAVALSATPPGRTDGLWQHTCFEAFVSGGGASYREYNFAPSGAWAAYGFDSYRAGMRNVAAAPIIDWRGGVLKAEVAIDLAGDWRLNLTAVIETSDGVKSYWALAHPDGPPDFHDPACFVLDLPAVG